jgi:hypothetical protein
MKIDIKKHWKLILFAALIITIIVMLIIIIRKKRSQTATDQIEVNKSNLTITDTQAVIIADNLLAAMNKYGTDEKAIFENLDGLNENDLLLVIKKFGLKPYHPSGFLATMWYQIKFFSSDLSLIGWLREELKGKDYERVKQIFNSNNIAF